MTVRPVQSSGTVPTVHEGSPGKSAGARQQDPDEVKAGFLDALPYLSDVQRNLIISRSQKVSFIDGFSEENLIFHKWGAGKAASFG